MKIMLVCYDKQLADLTAKSLERNGYDTVCCYDASNAETLIKRENVRLVIADLEVDEAQRLQFCKSLKSMKKPPKLLFIGSFGEEESRVLNVGADDWIKKPYKSAVFLARISALLRQSEYNLKPKAEEDFLV